MAQGSTRFEHLEKSIDDYIIEQQNKYTRAKKTRDVKLLNDKELHQSVRSAYLKKLQTKRPLCYCEERNTDLQHKQWIPDFRFF